MQKELTARQLNQRPDIFPDSLRQHAANTLFAGDKRSQLFALEQLGLFSDERVVIKAGTPLDSLVAYLQSTLAYDKGERDVVILHHNLHIRHPTGKTVGAHAHRRVHTMYTGGTPHRPGGVRRAERPFGNGTHGWLHGRDCRADDPHW